MSLSKKIDFAVLLSVRNANPNGDPLNGNRPRITYDGLGEISDVCIKRKIRDRIMESGVPIFVQADDRKIDEYHSLKARAEATLGKKMGGADTVKKACETWFDVRAFGQLFAFKSGKNDNSGVSIPIRGPVTVQSAFTIEPVSVTSTQITKSVSGEEGKDGKRSSDTMGMKHRIDSGYYVFYGSMNPQLAEKTGFDDQDAGVIKNFLPKLFENDASSARPEGSMRVCKVFWWEHNSKSGQYSSAKVHGTVRFNVDGTYEEHRLDGLTPEVLEGF